MFLSMEEASIGAKVTSLVNNSENITKKLKAIYSRHQINCHSNTFIDLKRCFRIQDSIEQSARMLRVFSPCFICVDCPPPLMQYLLRWNFQEFLKANFYALLFFS